MKLEQLKFGTSGLRGFVSSFRAENCFHYALSFCELLKRQFPNCQKIAVAGDLRESTPLITQYFVSTLQSQGFEIQNLGKVPTPVLALWAMEHGMAAVMITGSHIPADQNGVKFYTPLGEITKEHEKLIQDQYLALSSSLSSSPTDLRAVLPDSIQDLAENFYLRRYVDFFGAQCLKGLKVAFYQHSSVGRDFLPRVFQGLGASVQSFGFADKFVPVDTENLSNIENLHQTLKDMHADLLLSTDGDADRPLVVDAEKGLIRGDVLGIITSQILSVQRVVTPVSSTSLIEQTNYFAQVQRTKIGSPFVISGIESLVQNSSQPVAGFEANGGYLLASDIQNEAGVTLRALMTRDCTLPMMAYAKARIENRLDGVFQSFGEKSNVSGLVPEFPKEAAQWILDLLVKKPAEFLKESSLLAEEFSQLRAVDTLDGVKLMSEQMETVHFRPSGNAPEFRVYVEANSKARAEKYLGEALRLCQKVRDVNFEVARASREPDLDL